MGLMICFCFLLLCCFYNDQANRARPLISLYFPDFFLVAKRKPVQSFAPLVAVLQNVSDVSEFMASQFEPAQIPPDLRRHLRMMRHLKWALTGNFALILLYAAVY